MDKITLFRGDYFFLSNFYPAPIIYKGTTYASSEAAFQAMKCPERAEEFACLEPSKAKRLGREVPLRPDWEEVKTTVMYEVCLAKFTQHDWLRKMLISTGDAELVEGNDWDDTVWGVCNGVGENLLGKILMRIRDELKG